MLNGLCICYHTNGKKMKRYVYKNDIIVGLYEEYHLNGNKKIICLYNDLSLEDGEHIEYDKNEHIIKCCYYKDGYLQKLCDEFYEDGTSYKINEQIESNIHYPINDYDNFSFI